MAISQETVEEVLRRANVYEVISDYLPLKKVGSVYTALCPFHSEDTPSFTVSPYKNIFKCFGCGIAGNAIKFVMEYEKVSFGEAVEKIARKYGIPVKYIGVDNSRTQGLYKVSREILEFFKESLKSSSVAKKYLKDRGISARTVEEFELGYNPLNTELLINFAKKKGISLNDLADIGVLKRREEGGFSNIFRGRLIIPIKDVMGNVIAFGGRIVEGDSQAKYLNSPDTAIYKKGKSLFGIYESLPYIKEKKSVILVEGYMDLISLHQAGIKNVVASLGTSLTLEQAKLLRRYVDKVYIMFDSDRAGKLASISASSMLLSVGITPFYVGYSGSKDPDELVKKVGLSGIKTLIEQSSDMVIFLINNLEKAKDDKNFQKNYEYILNLLISIENPVIRMSYLRELSTKTGRAIADIEMDLKKYETTNTKKPVKIEEEKQQVSIDNLSINERIVLKYIFENKDVLKDKDVQYVVSVSNLGYFVDLIEQDLGKEVFEQIENYFKESHILVNQTIFLETIKKLKRNFELEELELKLFNLPEDNLEDYISQLDNFRKSYLNL